MTTDIRKLAEALEAFETEKNDPLNYGLTWTNTQKQAYLARKAYLGAVYDDNNHRNVIALIDRAEKAEADVARLRELVMRMAEILVCEHSRMTEIAALVAEAKKEIGG
jgi:endonuclease/exonuclease/phosphatase family metal-dependent hydrolase